MRGAVDHRRQRRVEPEKKPTSGNDFSSRHLIEAYAMGAETFGWAKRNPEPRAIRDGERLIGMSVTATNPYCRMPGGAARIHLSAEGHVTIKTARHEMGMGIATVQGQVAAG